jgi:hypothetical protein
MTDRPLSREHVRLSAMVCVHVVICCLSLIYVANFKFPGAFNPAEFHMFYDPARLQIAILAAAAFALVSAVFALAPFSFGYFVGFYLYTIVLSYLWLNCFTDLNYDHWLAGLSAAASAVAFLLPALFISAPLQQVYVLSAAAFDRLLNFILLVAVATVAAGAAYNFQLISVEHIYDFRDKNEAPTILRYLIGMNSGALMPFAFAGFAARKAYWRAGAVLLLLLLLYPITLSKLALFAPFWLVIVLMLSRLAEARAATILSLLVPIAAGLLLIVLFRERAAAMYFATVNFRMIAIPALAIDIYNDFFARHDLTYFCQISVLKRLMYCPYQDQLGIVMADAYKLGTFNASLFATEGIASVGLFLAPVAAFICGLVIALGNRVSTGLPCSFILISGAMLPKVLLDVPLTTVLLTYGGGLLFLLWYVMPRTIFGRGAGPKSATG